VIVPIATHRSEVGDAGDGARCAGGDGREQEIDEAVDDQEAPWSQMRSFLPRSGSRRRRVISWISREELWRGDKVGDASQLAYGSTPADLIVSTSPLGTVSCSGQA
jgi:hypothetical protein